MATEKITITEKLRLDIVERRKKEGISSYELSERVGNGHSKFWLQNIECGKTKKITKEDLISLYMTIDDYCDEEQAIEYIEQVTGQRIGNSSKTWFDFVKVPEDFSNIQTDNDLNDMLDNLLDNDLVGIIRSNIRGMSRKEKRAALTALQNLYYSFYKNPDQAFTLINIPVYAVDECDKKECFSSIDNLLSVAAKYNDLMIKNRSMETIRQWKDRDKYYDELDKGYIHTAFNNFIDILHQIHDVINTDNPDLHQLSDKFCIDVSFTIDKGQHDAVKIYLKSFRAYDGERFAKHIQECVKWFRDFKNTYDLPSLYEYIDKEFLNDIYDFLNGYGAILSSRNK